MARRLKLALPLILALAPTAALAGPWSLTFYAQNRLVDGMFNRASVTWPTSFYVALFRATAGQSPRSTAVTSGQTTIPATPNGRMYRCTTAGTTGSSEPTWPTTSGGTVTDGTAVWTEMSPDFQANNTYVTSVEVSGSGYTRATYASSATNWASTSGAGSTTTPSTGTTGTTSNNATISIGPSTGAWGVIGGVGLYDASTAGNLWVGAGVTTAQTVSGSGGTITFSAGSFQFQFQD